MRTGLRKIVSLAAIVSVVGIGGGSSLAAGPQDNVAAVADSPTPEQYFGFEMGAKGKLAGYSKILDYIKQLDDDSDRLKYERIGPSTMGNEYGLVTISSPENIDRLDELKAINKKLAQPRGMSDAEAKKLSRQSVPFYLLESTIHSTEVSNGQAIVDVVHRLATEESEYTDQVLQDSALLLVVSQNPDGQQLVIDYFHDTQGTQYKREYPDLYHKYVGHDTNRDWFMFTQTESKYMGRIQKEYNPVVVHNLHQKGPDEERIFVPPYKEPFDRDINPTTVQETSALGLGMGRKLTSEDKKGVVWKEGYDLWAPARHYMTYHGRPRILTEIASGSRLAYPYCSKDGKPLGSQDIEMNYVEPYDKSCWTLQQQVEYGETAIYAGLKHISKFGNEWLYNMYRVGKEGSDWKDAGRPYAFVIPRDQRDSYGTYELLKKLDFGQVQIHQATEPFTAAGKHYRAGSYVVKMDQGYARYGHMLMKIWKYPEIKECPTCELNRPYDTTGHTLWMFFGVNVDKVDKPFDANLTRVRKIEPRETTMPPAPAEEGAYLVRPNSYGVYHVVAALQKEVVPTFRSAKRFTADGRKYSAGTFIVPATDRARLVLERAQRKTGLTVDAVGSAPQVAGLEMKPGTRVGLYRDIGNMPRGWMHWTFEEYFGINYSLVGRRDFKHDLNALYDVIVLPNETSKKDIVKGISRNDYPKRFSWAYGVGRAGWKRLQEFVRDGGTLLAAGSATQTAKTLFDLPIEPAIPENSEDVFIPGTHLAQRYDRSNPVAWGMRRQWPIYFWFDQAYRITDDSRADAVSRYPRGGRIAKSGYADGAETLRGAANVISYRVGDGKVVTYGSQMFLRTWPRHAWKMLFNPIYNGPAKKLAPTQMSKLQSEFTTERKKLLN